MSGSRRRWTAEEKLRILQEGRQTGASVAEVFRRHGISAGQFYGWEKRVHEAALEALRRPKRASGLRPQEELEVEVGELRVATAEVLKENLRLEKGRWP